MLRKARLDKVIAGTRQGREDFGAFVEDCVPDTAIPD